MSSDIYKSAADNTPLCLKIFDADSRLIFLNKAGLKEHGLKNLEALAEFDWLSTMEKENVDSMKTALKTAMDGKTGDVIFKHISGSDRKWCHGIFSPLTDKDGKNIGVAFYSLDISEIKEKYDESEKMNKFMIDRELKMVELKAKIKDLEEKNQKIIPPQTPQK